MNKDQWTDKFRRISEKLSEISDLHVVIRGGKQPGRPFSTDVEEVRFFRGPESFGPFGATFDGQFVI
jgi:hypothetical protein